MIVNHLHQFAFFHVPKNAGSTIGKVLITAAPKSFPVNDHNPEISPKPIGHWTPARAIEQHPWVKRYWRFAFSRDPWARAVSLYHFLLDTKGQNFGGQFPTFERWLHATDEGPITGDWPVLRPGELARPQVYWMKNAAGEIDVGVMGKVEDLRTGLNAVFDHLELDRPTRIPQINQSQHGPWRSYYSTTRLVDIVAEQYAEDIEAFGYSF